MDLLIERFLLLLLLLFDRLVIHNCQQRVFSGSAEIKGQSETDQAPCGKDRWDVEEDRAMRKRNG